MSESPVSKPQNERRPIVAANWKMNLLRADAQTFGHRLSAELPEGRDHGTDVVIFPSFPLLQTVATEFAPTEWRTACTAAVGGQDLHPQDSGAHTGDTSAAQLVDVGCTWALVGHSERRADHGESDQLVAQKAAAALRHGLKPMICLGESDEQRQKGETEAVLAEQLVAVAPVLAQALAEAPTTEFALAYEPIWAIGTGKTATPELAQQAHRFLRSELERHLGADRARATRVLYGGSAKPDNAAALIAESDLDGFLVGGASLDPDSFLAIIRTVGATAGPETEV